MRRQRYRPPMRPTAAQWDGIHALYRNSTWTVCELLDEAEHEISQPFTRRSEAVAFLTHAKAYGHPKAYLVERVTRNAPAEG